VHQRHPRIEQHLRRPQVLFQVELAGCRPVERVTSQPHDHDVIDDLRSEPAPRRTGHRSRCRCRYRAPCGAGIRLQVSSTSGGAREPLRAPACSLHYSQSLTDGRGPGLALHMAPVPPHKTVQDDFGSPMFGERRQGYEVSWRLLPRVPAWGELGAAFAEPVGPSSGPRIGPTGISAPICRTEPGARRYRPPNALCSRVLGVRRRS
jgi:hypothetical protein